MDKAIFQHILLWVENNLNTGKRIDSLVKYIGYSRRTIEKHFQREYGVSLGEYILNRKISRAAILVRWTLLTITEVADLFHYHSAQNFARAFKKVTKHTPTEYREKKLDILVFSTIVYLQ